MYIENLAHLIQVYKDNDIPIDTPLNIDVSFEASFETGKVSVMVDGNRQRYGLKLNHCVLKNDRRENELAEFMRQRMGNPRIVTIIND